MHVVIVTRRAAQDEQYWSGVGQLGNLLRGPFPEPESWSAHNSARCSTLL